MDIPSASSTTNLEDLTPVAQGMTDAQRVATREILAGYDPDRLTYYDVRDIHSAFHEAGIRPCEEHRDMVYSIGFDTHQLRPRFDDSFAPPASKVDGFGKPTLLNEMLEILKSGKLLEFLQSEEPELMKMFGLFEPDELVELLESRNVDQKMTDEQKAAARKILETFDAPENAVGSSDKQTFLREMLEMFEVLKMLGSGKWDKSMLDELRTALAVSGNGNAGNMIDRHA